MIIFKKLRYQNFMSVGNYVLEFTLDQVKTTLLIGVNGSGKSTISEALCFALYGKPFRNINKPQLVNSITGKNLLVELEFVADEHEYLIRRGIKPAVFEIYRNGQLVDQRAESKDYQKLIDQSIMKISYKAFCQRVILGSANFVPFMQLSAAARREFIEDLLDIQIFSTMNSLLKDKIQNNKSQLAINEQAIQTLNKIIAINQSHNKQLKDQSEQTIHTNNLQIQQYLEMNSKCAETIEQTIQEISSLEAEYKKIVLLEDKMSKVNGAIGKLQFKHEQYNKEMNFYSDSSQCSKCYQEIPEDFKARKVSEIQHSLRDSLDIYQKLKAVHEKLNESFSRFELLNVKIKQLHSIVNENNNTIAVNNRLIINLQKHNKQIEGYEVKDESEYTEQSTELELQRKALLEERELNAIASLLLKDDGIKTKIIRQYIPVINKSINRYLDQMGFFCKFEIDENFNECIKSRHRDEFSYSSFSEGEKTRIDLALLFTWREIAKCRNSASINLLILDEIMDSSLDTSGTDEFVNIMKHLTEHNNVFVISHREFVNDKFDRTIQFQKQQNFTKLV